MAQHRQGNNILVCCQQAKEKPLVLCALAAACPRAAWRPANLWIEIAEFGKVRTLDHVFGLT